MADAVTDALREAATHRGYRLQRSRKKTPGVGDYGKFGLTDSRGKPVLGIGKDGLTATADEIESFLRRSETATWRQSAAQPVARAKRPDTKTKAGGATPTKRADEPVPKPSRSSTKTPAERKPPRRAAAKVPSPAPELVVRRAAPHDLGGIAMFVVAETKESRPVIARRLDAFAKGDSGLVIAERGRVIGLLAWTVAPALHRDPVVRIATLLVAEKEQRSGIGRALVEKAEALLAACGHREMEAMSDIAIRSAHGFFRKLGFNETSYRFAKPLGKPRK